MNLPPYQHKGLMPKGIWRLFFFLLVSGFFTLHLLGYSSGIAQGLGKASIDDSVCCKTDSTNWNYGKHYQYQGVNWGWDVYDSVGRDALLDSLDLRQAYVDAKWRFYCSCCYREAFRQVFEHEHLQKACLGALRPTFGEMKFDVTRIAARDNQSRAGKSKDTAKNLWVFVFSLGYCPNCYYFPHLCRDCLYGLWYDRRDPTMPALAQFDDRTSVDLRYTVGFGEALNTCYLNWQEPQDIFRCVYPIQPEVVKYVRENANKINPWFRAAAMKRGLYDSVKYPPAEVEKELERRKNKDYTLHPGDNMWARND